jgi:LmbE family N-acetylglucosaminyl deacetylase
MTSEKQETNKSTNQIFLNRTQVPTILAIGAHPDDIEVGCGGTLKVLADLGYKVYGVILTDGERGGDREKRLEEASASARILGLENIFFEHFYDGKVLFDVDTVTAIEKYIQKLQPQKIFTHTKEDRHQDHWSCSCATRAAARRSVKEILMYEIYGSTTVSFTPHYIVDISEAIKFKLSSLKVHQSQVRKGVLSLEGLKERAGSIGKEHGYKYAEAFEINHLLFDIERLTIEFNASKHANNPPANYHYDLKAKTGDRLNS